jgi:tryptophan synthase beta chain
MSTTTAREAAVSAVPDATGHFGSFGGRLAPEALMSALDELTTAYETAKADPAFQAELATLLRDFAGRPTMLTEVPPVRRAGRRLPGVP